VVYQVSINLQGRVLDACLCQIMRHLWRRTMILAQGATICVYSDRLLFLTKVVLMMLNICAHDLFLVRVVIKMKSPS